jgi:hypothetical protein
MARRLLLICWICLTISGIAVLADAPKAPNNEKHKHTDATQCKPDRCSAINSLLSLGTSYRNKGQYSKARLQYEVCGLLAGTWRLELLADAEEQAKRIARIEKLIEIEGERADLKKKLKESNESITAIRSANFDLWLLRIRALVAAGEMAEVGADRDGALGYYSEAHGYYLILSHLDISDMTSQQRDDFSNIGLWPKKKIEKLGEDIRVVEEGTQEELKKLPPLPYL